MQWTTQIFNQYGEIATSNDGISINPRSGTFSATGAVSPRITLQPNLDVNSRMFSILFTNSETGEELTSLSITQEGQTGGGENPTELTVTLLAMNASSGELVTALDCENSRIWLVIDEQYTEEWGVSYTWYKDNTILFENSGISGFGISKEEGLEAGIYNVIATANDGRTAQASIEITGSTEGCEEQPTEITVAITTPDGTLPEITCAQQRVTLIASVVPNNVSFEWARVGSDGTFVLLGNSSTITVNEAGSYRLTAFNEHGAASAIINIADRRTEECGEQPIYGCMDETAVNYDPNATVHVASDCKYGIVPQFTAQADFTEFGAEGGSTNVYITSNVSWVANVIGEISINPQQGREGNTTGTITVEPNTTANTRMFMIMFRNNNTGLDTLVFTQAGATIIEPVYGCMDRSAINFNPNATVQSENSPCEYQSVSISNIDGYELNCDVQEITINAVATPNNVTFNWTKDGAVVGSGNRLTIAEAGTYEVTVVNMNNNNAIANATVIIDDVRENCGGNDYFEVSIAAETTELSCEQTEIRLTANAINVPAGSTVSYQWVNIPDEILPNVTDIDDFSPYYIGTNQQSITITEAGNYGVFASTRMATGEGMVHSALIVITGGCETQPVYGCMDQTAINYNPQATQQTATTPCNFLTADIRTSEGTVFDCNTAIEFITLYAGANTNNVAFEWYKENEFMGSVQEITVTETGVYTVIAISQNNPLAKAEATVTLTAITDCGEEPVYGCMDETALNYNPQATVHVANQCKYDTPRPYFYATAETTQFGAQSGSTLVTIDANIQSQWTVSVVGGANAGASVNPQLGSVPSSVQPRIMVQANPATESRTIDIVFVARLTTGEEFVDTIRIFQEGRVVEIIYGCMEADASNYNPLATQQTANTPCIYYGCMDSSAINFNPRATLQTPNTPCQYAIYGCMNPNATNYNPLATHENNNCIFTSTASGCPVFRCASYISNQTLTLTIT